MEDRIIVCPDDRLYPFSTRREAFLESIFSARKQGGLGVFRGRLGIAERLEKDYNSALEMLVEKRLHAKRSDHPV